MVTRILRGEGLVHTASGIIIVASLALACSDAEGPSQPPITPAAFIVSNPVQPLEPAVTGASTGATFEPTVVYISLPPGAIPNGVTATIRNLRTGTSVTAQLVNGGFDPVTLPAVEGDTIAIDVQRIGASPLKFRVTALARRRPSVVRTSPPPHKRDVSLNAIVVIVFSEPLDETTLNGSSVQLWRGTTPVGGTVRFGDVPHLRAEFHPDSLLEAETDYQLVVTTAVADVDGLALDSAITVPFTTGTSVPATDLVFASVDAGGHHACGVTINGAAYCWGDNTYGQLGDGTTASSFAPIAVAGGLTFQAVSAGGDFTCGITTSGAAYCWGDNWDGQLGLGVSTGPYTSPVAVPGALTFASVSAGGLHTCSVTIAGAAYCWGSDLSGDLGDGTGGESSNGRTPVLVAGGQTFATVSAGAYHTCGVITSGAAYCWGWNMGGRLGDGTEGWTISRLSPVAVLGGLTFAAVSAGGGSTCGITTTGSAYCWGLNHTGDLGIGKAGPEQCEFVDDSFQPIFLACSHVPVKVAGGLTFAALRVATGACGVTALGAGYCWGWNSVGGSTTIRSAPVAVAGGLSFAAISAGWGALRAVSRLAV
jgi:alpha-tubulin suppressor-like RCC1 family protein